MATFQNSTKHPLYFQPLIRCKLTAPFKVPQVSITTPKGLLMLNPSEVESFVKMVDQFRTQPGLIEVSSRGVETREKVRPSLNEAFETFNPPPATATVLGCTLPLFETLHGPGGLQLELDAFEIDLNDPGQGTPAMVYATGLTLSSSCSSAPFDCACDTGYVDGFELSQTQAAWLNRHSQRVENFIAEWCVELEKRGLTHLPQPAVMPQSLADEDSGDCSKPGCSGRACPHAAEGFEGYVDSCPKHAHQLFMAELREGNIVLVSPRSTRTHGA